MLSKHINSTNVHCITTKQKRQKIHFVTLSLHQISEIHICVGNLEENSHVHYVPRRFTIFIFWISKDPTRNTYGFYKWKKLRKSKFQTPKYGVGGVIHVFYMCSVRLWVILGLRDRTAKCCRMQNQTTGCKLYLLSPWLCGWSDCEASSVEEASSVPSLLQLGGKAMGAPGRPPWSMVHTYQYLWNGKH